MDSSLPKKNTTVSVSQELKGVQLLMKHVKERR